MNVRLCARRQSKAGGSMTALCRTGQASLTRHLHDVSGNDVPSFDSLDGLAVHAVNLSHFWFVLLQSLDGVLSIPLLQRITGMSLSLQTH